MKTIIALVVVIGTFAAIAADSWPPKVNLPQALQIAQKYVQTNKIDTSRLCLTKIETQTDPKGNHYWEILWANADTNRWVNGVHFWIRIHMDRTATFHGGE